MPESLAAAAERRFHPTPDSSYHYYRISFPRIEQLLPISRKHVSQTQANQAFTPVLSLS